MSAAVCLRVYARVCACVCVCVCARARARAVRVCAQTGRTGHCRCRWIAARAGSCEASAPYRRPRHSVQCHPSHIPTHKGRACSVAQARRRDSAPSSRHGVSKRHGVFPVRVRVTCSPAEVASPSDVRMALSQPCRLSQRARASTTRTHTRAPGIRRRRMCCRQQHCRLPGAAHTACPHPARPPASTTLPGPAEDAKGAPETPPTVPSTT